MTAKGGTAVTYQTVNPITNVQRIYVDKVDLVRDVCARLSLVDGAPAPNFPVSFPNLAVTPAGAASVESISWYARAGACDRAATSMMATGEATASSNGLIALDFANCRLDVQATLYFRGSSASDAAELFSVTGLALDGCTKR